MVRVEPFIASVIGWAIGNLPINIGGQQTTIGRFIKDKLQFLPPELMHLRGLLAGVIIGYIVDYLFGDMLGKYRDVVVIGLAAAFASDTDIIAFGNPKTSNHASQPQEHVEYANSLGVKYIIT